MSDVRFEQFVLDRLFEKIQSPSLGMKASDFPTNMDAEHRIRLLTAGAENQGFARYAKRTDVKQLLRNVISISANGANTGVTFYQPCEFAVLQDSYAIQPKDGLFELDEDCGLYLVTSINKAIRFGRDWSNKAGWSNIRYDEISLPIQLDAAFNPIIDGDCRFHDFGYVPDWGYMRDRIRELEQDRIRELEAYLMATGLTDCVLTDEDRVALNAMKNEGGGVS